MRQLTLLLLFHQALASFSDIKDCVIDYRSLENRWDKKLIDDLEKCKYDLFESPPQNTTEHLQVNIGFALRNFKLISEEQAFIVHMWIFMSWQDERLKWDPTKYENFDWAVHMSSKIWTPGIKLINSISQEFDRFYCYGPSVITSRGLVSCVARDVFEVKCGTDLRDWPYDAQTCKLEIGPYSETPKILLDVKGKAITIIGADHGAAWNIMDFHQEEHQTSEKQLIMTFRLDRHADVLSAIVIFPSFILSVLTLSTLFIDARLSNRLLVMCFSLMCHFNFLSEMALDIPKHSKESPRLLLYYRGSFILTSVSIVLSYVLKVLCAKKTECPKWIISSNDFVYTKFVKFIIWPRWGTIVLGDASANKVVKDWTDFANVINSVWIVVTVIVYICLYYMFIPHPNPYNF